MGYVDALDAAQRENKKREAEAIETGARIATEAYEKAMEKMYKNEKLDWQRAYDFALDFYHLHGDRNFSGRAVLEKLREIRRELEKLAVAEQDALKRIKGL